MPVLLAPLARAVTYTRWLHLLVGAIVPLACAMVHPGLDDPSRGGWVLIAVTPVPLALAAASVPSVRRAEGLQARLMLLPGPHARPGGGEVLGVSAVASASWSDRARTGAWLILRLEAGLVVAVVTNALMGLTLSLAGAATGRPGVTVPLPHVSGTGWGYALLAPVPLVALVAVVSGAGAVMARAACRLLGPTAGERLSALQRRHEQLLERNAIARELHDTLGHALTLAVVQAGAARVTADPAFTNRALESIEETGRAALEDLERVLLALRETERPSVRPPGLEQAGRLIESARSSGAQVDAEVTGLLDHVPGPVSREGYRMLQEALTNVLRHAGGARAHVRVAVGQGRLRLEVRNALCVPAPASGATGGHGLRGIRERAALLGGEAQAGEADGQWRVHVDLPLR